MTHATIEPMHFDCLGCRARTKPDPELHTLAILVVLVSGEQTLDDVCDDLCGHHRARLDEAVDAMRGHGRAS